MTAEPSILSRNENQPKPSPDDVAELAELRARQDRLMALLGTKSPAKLEHDVRNVLNEVALLRKLAELEG